MIQHFEPPRYHIESIDLSINPDRGQVVQGHVQIDLDMNSPKLCEEPEGFCCSSNMDLNLNYGSYPIKEDDNPSTFGQVTVDTTIFVPAAQSEVEPYYKEWNEGAYNDMDSEFIDHLESGILSHILNPIANVLSDSFEGVVPRIRFTRSPSHDNNKE